MESFVETERLLLRRLREEDFSDFCAYAADEEMSRMMGRDRITDAKTARPTFEWLVKREARAYALVLKESGRVIGNLNVTQPPQTVRQCMGAERAGCALSFCIGRQHQRKGLMEEVVRATLAALFTEGMDYVNCGNFAFNEASRALQRKLGFAPLLCEEIEQGGVCVTVEENILRKNEWRTAR